ncbi:5'-methylthioadenosine/S-adenosylhomocysteine nucleosidase-like isoform X2 [Phoenix dactylifera]|uniref:5'-methylthioadenosine/S-adenosylhomocysteine nucleosidase-like isoform X2 n=1 Tax=Phoenix dactylifera TaxID=42345 RepID=A0A8B9ALE2_PHODC|nr:5'-methylthioadenosine/S-adenosylhomocysteine nucleosidase-like isoform X2 [Phoenix dactylifera]
MAPPVKNAVRAAAAPTEEWSSQPEVTAAHPPKNAAGDGDRRPISTVLIIIAMQTEALPLVNKFHLSEDIDGSLFPKGVPWVRYHGIYKELHINLVWTGKDSILVEFSKFGCVLAGVDSIGTISASLVSYASIQALKPDLIINAGTAGGFKAKGACVADVYLVSNVAFHDRRIPIHVNYLYGIGARQTFSTPNLIDELNLKVGKLSTGDSLDMSPQDEVLILANDAVVKDMEGAAVAYVADLLSVPAIFIKAVTNTVDGQKSIAEEFLQNLIAVCTTLAQTVSQVVDFISGVYQIIGIRKSTSVYRKLYINTDEYYILKIMYQFA